MKFDYQQVAPGHQLYLLYIDKTLRGYIVRTGKGWGVTEKMPGLGVNVIGGFQKTRRKAVQRFVAHHVLH